MLYVKLARIKAGKTMIKATRKKIPSSPNWNGAYYLCATEVVATTRVGILFRSSLCN